MEKIVTGIAVRYLEPSDFPNAAPGQSRLYIKGTAVKIRVDERDGTPRVVIDGRDYSWEEFGEFLSSYTGFDFRLECFDASETREISPDPARPNPLWWLPDAESDEESDESGDDRRHH